MAPFCSASPYKKAVALELFQVDQAGASLKAAWGLVGSNHFRGLGLYPQDKEENKEKILACTLYLNNSCEYTAAKDHEKKQNRPSWEHRHAGICRDLTAFLKGRGEEFHMMYEYWQLLDK